MIDPLITLSMSIHANPGVYALLLGSGISRPAKIPTGWEVVQDLIRRIAAASGEDCEPDPEAWYREKFDSEPTYSGLLETIGKSQAERSRLLRSYFEPSEDELENGDKQPTRAHIAIAQMVKQGHIRVILTTNFDKLMERALEAVGITPSVIASPDAIAGAMPPAHAECTILKLHGDYTDLRTRNTPAELSAYDPKQDAFLDRILDEYGIIISGWSGDWDEALRNAFQRKANRRFTTWWTRISDLSEDTQRLAVFLGSEQIIINSADLFFDDLAEKLSALRQFEKPHPLSITLAVALTKKYVPESRYKISIADLMGREIEKVMSEISEEKYPLRGGSNNEEYARRISEFEEIMRVALHIAATGCFWDRGEHIDIWTRALNRLVNQPQPQAWNNGMLAIRFHPTRLLLYACGISYVAKSEYRNILQLFSISCRQRSERETSLLYALFTHTAWQDVFKTIPELSNRTIPVSDRMFTVMRPVFKELVPSDDEYLSLFDTYEILQSFELSSEIDWGVPGAFMYRSWQPQLQKIVKDVEQRNLKSDLLSSGFCHGSLGSFEKAKEQIYRSMQQYSF